MACCGERPRLRCRSINDPRRKQRGIAVCRCSSMGLTPQAAGNVTQRDSNRPPFGSHSARQDTEPSPWVQADAGETWMGSFEPQQRPSFSIQLRPGLILFLSAPRPRDQLVVWAVRQLLGAEPADQPEGQAGQDPLGERWVRSFERVRASVIAPGSWPATRKQIAGVAWGCAKQSRLGLLNRRVEQGSSRASRNAGPDDRHAGRPVSGRTER
jgi:hypothetical protein